MKKGLFAMLLASIFALLTACNSAQNQGESSAPTIQDTTTSSTAAKETTQPTAAATEPAQTQTNYEQPEYAKEHPQEIQTENLQMIIGGTPVSVAWEDNDAVQALKELCKNQPLTIYTSMYGGFEQVGSIGSYLPQNDVQTTTSAGDIVLYSGNQMVVFYGSNTWAYTRLGHITDKTPEELTQLLSNENITITLSY